MKDLCLEPTALSNVATTEPFPLLSHDAVLQHRRELFSPEVLDNCLHYTRPGSVQLRGMAPRYAPFIHKFWHSPEVLKIVSSIAGVDLVPAMDYEVSHTNVQLGPGGLDAVRSTPVEPPTATEEAIRAFEADKAQKRAVTDQTKPIIEWHKDSHPWVCVVMLSDARHMTGGETELMKGDGTTLKVKAPQMGCAVLLQGRYITHTAAPVDNMPERVTIVTSFRPRNPMLPDETTNANVRNKSHLSELYYQWTTYRLDVLAQRARITADALRRRYDENVKANDPEGKKGMCLVETVNVGEVEAWAEEQIKYIRETLHEMRPLDKSGK
ncbi:2OG-Fe(II) oxygenase superfamily domain-containing protein [Purpureocillium lilacinum]|uniref:2OG-Fe(II) oxygenase superfamily domain-containing protein n=1 Tax=Purpureocillium lilacinum TaxID=33203 RepID=A0A179H2R8_PURLI|nr:2OG-Fe(II) oxygenase superfamily domain-containing protein [Purpureocillium lilacinum]